MASRFGSSEYVRREFLARAGVFSAIVWLPETSYAQDARTRLILLGTGGGPRPRKTSSAAAQVIISHGVSYVIDCGDGVARQLARADVTLSS